MAATAKRAATWAQTSPRSIVLIGNYPPRRCGIATFTADLRGALLAAEPGVEVRVLAMVDGAGPYDFPAEVMATVPQDDAGAYREAARHINALRPDVVCVQHEYGIFGGTAGERLLDLLDELDAPVVATLHTILTAPDPDQKRVLQALGRRACRLVTMARRGLEMLPAIYGIAEGKLAMIPHGAPDRPPGDPGRLKRELGYGDGPLLFSFGLLSPNKGLQQMVRALPALMAEHPRLRYVVLGATHPNLLAREGEAYRDRLAALAAELGVEDHLRLVNRYADDADLIAHLGAADVYVTPYLNEAQITSGTLSYALALGKPVVSTPYWHAQELLADGRGVLVAAGDPMALGRGIGRLLADDRLRAEIAARAYAYGRETTWSRVAAQYLESFDCAQQEAKVVALRPAAALRPAPSLKGVQRLTDDCGVIQHASYEVPDRSQGYCTDDNARALILTVQLARREGPSAELARLASTYAAFVHHAWNPAEERFRNFMGYDRRWLEAAGSQDSNGRAFWALAVAAGDAPGLELRAWASGLVDRTLGPLRSLSSPRAQAFAILGACALLETQPARGEARDMALVFAQVLQRRLADTGDARWRWFEPVLAYDNARLPEALIRAGVLLDRPDLEGDGVAALDWLCRRQSAPSGRFRAVGSDSFGRVRQPPLPFDQQPLEAAATVDACLAAWEATGDPAWLERADTAYDWFLGGNELDTPLVHAEAGLCYDGLTPRGVNLNQGAESVLAFQLATVALGAVHRGADAEAPSCPA